MLVIGSAMNSANAPGRFTPTPSVCAHKMPPSRQAVAAASAHQVAFAADDIAGVKIVDIRAHRDDLTHKLVPDHHRHRDRLLRPLVPLVNVDVRTADTRLSHPDQHIVDPVLGLRNVLQPQVRDALPPSPTPSSQYSSWGTLRAMDLQLDRPAQLLQLVLDHGQGLRQSRAPMRAFDVRSLSTRSRCISSAWILRFLSASARA